MHRVDLGGNAISFRELVRLPASCGVGAADPFVPSPQAVEMPSTGNAETDKEIVHKVASGDVKGAVQVGAAAAGAAACAATGAGAAVAALCGPVAGEIAGWAVDVFNSIFGSDPPKPSLIWEGKNLAPQSDFSMEINSNLKSLAALRERLGLAKYPVELEPILDKLMRLVPMRLTGETYPALGSSFSAVRQAAIPPNVDRNQWAADLQTAVYNLAVQFAQEGARAQAIAQAPKKAPTLRSGASAKARADLERLANLTAEDRAALEALSPREREALLRSQTSTKQAPAQTPAQAPTKAVKASAPTLSPSPAATPTPAPAVLGPYPASVL